MPLGKQRDVFIHHYLKALDCPRALTVWLLYDSGEHVQLGELAFNPYHYNGFQAAQDALSATSLLSKAPFLETGIDLEQVALKKFDEAEQKCRLTNRRIYRGELSSDALSALDYMTVLIERVLGEFDLDEWLEMSEWGPGATTTISRRRATRAHKYNVERCITKSLYELISSVRHEAYPHWGGPLCISEHSKIITVPKNAKTDRTIAIEPGVNLFFQRGLGKMIRRRLQRVGVDLSDQNRNGDLARQGSKHDSLATVDFSAASDTISRAIVDRLLPKRWFAVLNSARSVAGKVGNRILYFEKFSSMGNGFTFELETLIFWSLAKYCVSRTSDTRISVYGDDVILPTSSYERYAKLANEFGFSVNNLKSFAETSYRESCGTHWWNGVDIRPIFMKKNYHDTHEIIALANQVRLQAWRRNGSISCDRRLRRSWEVLRRYLDGKVPRTPPELGDAGLISREGEKTLQRPLRGGHEGFLVRGFVVKPRVYKDLGSVGLLCVKYRNMDVRLPLLAQRSASQNWVTRMNRGDVFLRLDAFVSIQESGASDLGNTVSLPLSTSYSLRWIRCLQWTDLGPWA